MILMTTTSNRSLKVMESHQLNLRRCCPRWKAFCFCERSINCGGQSIAAARNGGTISVIGALAGGAGPVPLVNVLMRQLRMQGVFVGPKRAFERLVRAVEANRIEPIVGATYSLSELPEALEHLSKGAHLGKIALSADR